MAVEKKITFRKIALSNFRTTEPRMVIKCFSDIQRTVKEQNCFSSTWRSKIICMYLLSIFQCHLDSYLKISRCSDNVSGLIIISLSNVPISIIPTVVLCGNNLSNKLQFISVIVLKRSLFNNYQLQLCDSFVDEVFWPPVQGRDLFWRCKAAERKQPVWQSQYI